MKQSTENKKVKNVPNMETVSRHLYRSKKGIISTLLSVCMVSLVLISCEQKDAMENAKPIQNFTLTIENVFTPKMFFNAGETEGIPPGDMYTFSFDAGQGHYLSFETMLGQSNDLFFGFDDTGLELYDMNGMPVTGDVTDKVYLWDAGTEVNEQPGVGPNQAPRQSNPDTGVDENGNVMKIMDVMDGFSYPDVKDMIQVVLTHDYGTTFTVMIKNLSDMASLMSPYAPGVWAVHGSGAMLYTEGMPASEGLERAAEDGNNMILGEYAMMNAGFVSPFAPGVYAIYQGLNPIFKDGKEASAALEMAAEDGDPSMFNFDAIANVESWGIFNTPMSGSDPAPIFPGEKYEITFTASQGDVLSFESMLGQTNDLFIAPEGISLYMNGQPLSGDITEHIKLWDAKTELNEYPGAGPTQAPRQSEPNTGVDEEGNVELVNDKFTYPDVKDMIKVTLSLN